MERKASIGFIATVFNEEKLIDPFLKSLQEQSIILNEIVIVDGFSKDNTYKKLLEFKEFFPHKSTTVKILRRKGNRSVGRNFAIKNCSSSIIAISDSGCVLDKNWIKEIVKPFKDGEVAVVAGFYKGEAKTTFQKALIPYVLVMPEKLNARNFLPATRSMAIRKKIFTSLKGFNESLSNNEDYAFAKRIEKNGIKIAVARKALVTWIPRANTNEAFIMFYRFALGDIESGIIRPKVLSIFARYCVLFALLLMGILGIVPLYYFLFALFMYCLYILSKNKRYSRSLSMDYMFLYVQFLSDCAVLSGSLMGAYYYLKRISSTP